MYSFERRHCSVYSDEGVQFTTAEVFNLAAVFNPPENTADENGRMYLNLLAEEFSMTPIKVRKLLISSGIYQTEISVRINELYKSGKTIKEIQENVGLSAASVSGYLPYQKTVYNLEVSTDVANRLRKYRNRKTMVENLPPRLKREQNKQRICCGKP